MRAYHGAHQRLKRVEYAALSGGPHRADLNDLHIACREAIGIVAGGLKVDDQHGHVGQQLGGRHGWPRSSSATRVSAAGSERPLSARV